MPMNLAVKMIKEFAVLRQCIHANTGTDRKRKKVLYAREDSNL